MLLQYPKLSTSATVRHYDDYRKLHHDFIRSYKALYEDVAGFSLLPERFINEAGPIIEKFLGEHCPSSTPAGKRMQLQVITDFISRFYDFMDDATEMFVEHQALSDQTLAYMQKVSLLSKEDGEECIYNYKDGYYTLAAELEKLNVGLIAVREQVDETADDLDLLKPVWEKIRENILN